MGGTSVTNNHHLQVCVFPPALFDKTTTTPDIIDAWVPWLSPPADPTTNTTLDGEYSPRVLGGHCSIQCMRKCCPRRMEIFAFFCNFLTYLLLPPSSPPFLLFQLTSAAVPEGGQGCVVRPKKRLSDFKPPSYVLLKCHSCLSGHEPEFTKASFSLCLIHSFPTLWLSGRLTDQD